MLFVTITFVVTITKTCLVDIRHKIYASSGVICTTMYTELKSIYKSHSKYGLGIIFV